LISVTSTLDWKYYKANALTFATMPGIVLANSPLSAGQAGNFIRRGQVTNKNWAWTAVGGFVYAGLIAAVVIQTAPAASGNQLQIVGIATSATQIDFEPQFLLVEVA
jgi:hypothetical protein